MEPGRPQRVDDAYERQGCCNLFLIFQPLTGWRDVHVTERRTKGDVARHMTWLVDDVVPEAAGIRVALDNRNTHTPAVLYQTVPPAEARRLTRTLAVHAPPKHGSWLNMTAIACSILARQCLDRRLPDSVSVAARETHGQKPVVKSGLPCNGGSPRPMPGSRFVAFIISNQCGQVLVRYSGFISQSPLAWKPSWSTKGDYIHYHIFSTLELVTINQKTSSRFNGILFSYELKWRETRCASIDPSSKTRRNYVL